MDIKFEQHMSERLRRIASMVDKCNVAADVGTDHGYIPICLVKNNIAKFAIAMDINPKPLERAKENINKMGAAGRVDVRLSDGLEKLHRGEADTVIISGMGGRLMMKILEEGRKTLEETETLILSPHSDIESMRIYLADNNYNILDEKMVVDDGKYYNIIKAVHGKMLIRNRTEARYGMTLLEKHDRVLYEYLIKERKKYKIVLSGMTGAERKNTEGIKEIEDKLDVISNAMKYFEVEEKSNEYV